MEASVLSDAALQTLRLVIEFVAVRGRLPLHAVVEARCRPIVLRGCRLVARMMVNFVSRALNFSSIF